MPWPLVMMTRFDGTSSEKGAVSPISVGIIDSIAGIFQIDQNQFALDLLVRFRI